MTSPGERRRPVVLVVPCFNEAARLSRCDIEQLLSHPDVGLVLVDDGSTDATLALLNGFAEKHPAVTVLPLATNSGKAEAVRRGLLTALEGEPDVIGFIDADFATPAAEVLRLVAGIRLSDGPDVVLGSRVLLSGRTVVRSPVRHVLGRVIATYLSLAYSLLIYDTQCGAKLFRVDDRLRGALAAPFATRWLFDVELLLRIREWPGAHPATVREEPLEVWRDVAGSRLGGRAVRQVLADFLALHRRHG